MILTALIQLREGDFKLVQFRTGEHVAKKKQGPKFLGKRIG